ncbi:hypothetical protein [Nakamurella panacisegetis]|uniref:hypothetical protein n=1 Tax=Nakamurella panacisegetis TaxID=1090615 RepID=UPI00155FB419|nr:hypothetical protein [Nakamurella panacisegetis]
MIMALISPYRTPRQSEISICEYSPLPKAFDPDVIGSVTQFPSVGGLGTGTAWAAPVIVRPIKFGAATAASNAKPINSSP